MSPNSCKLHLAQIQVHLLLCLFHICTTFLTQRLRVVKGPSASKTGGRGPFYLVYMYVLLYLLFCPRAVCGIPQLQCIQPRHLLLVLVTHVLVFPPGPFEVKKNFRELHSVVMYVHLLVYPIHMRTVWLAFFSVCRAICGKFQLSWAAFGRHICAFTTLQYVYGYSLTCFLFLLQGYLW